MTEPLYCCLCVSSPRARSTYRLVVVDGRDIYRCGWCWPRCQEAGPVPAVDLGKMLAEDLEAIRGEKS